MSSINSQDVTLEFDVSNEIYGSENIQVNYDNNIVTVTLDGKETKKKVASNLNFKVTQTNNIVSITT